MILHICITLADLCALRPCCPASYVPLWQARGVRIRTMQDFDGTIETGKDPAIQARHFRQILPREERTPDEAR
jgi:hypothetical protein